MGGVPGAQGWGACRRRYRAREGTYGAHKNDVLEEALVQQRVPLGKETNGEGEV